jgi:hypothetical protein
MMTPNDQGRLALSVASSSSNRHFLFRACRSNILTSTTDHHYYSILIHYHLFCYRTPSPQRPSHCYCCCRGCYYAFSDCHSPTACWVSFCLIVYGFIVIPNNNNNNKTCTTTTIVGWRHYSCQQNTRKQYNNNHPTAKRLASIFVESNPTATTATAISPTTPSSCHPRHSLLLAGLEQIQRYGSLAIDLIPTYNNNHVPKIHEQHTHSLSHSHSLTHSLTLIQRKR